MIFTNSQLLGLTTLLILTLAAWWSSFTKMTHPVWLSISGYDASFWIIQYNTIQYNLQLCKTAYLLCAPHSLNIKPTYTTSNRLKIVPGTVKETWLSGKILTNNFCMIKKYCLLCQKEGSMVFSSFVRWENPWHFIIDRHISSELKKKAQATSFKYYSAKLGYLTTSTSYLIN